MERVDIGSLATSATRYDERRSAYSFGPRLYSSLPIHGAKRDTDVLRLTYFSETTVPVEVEGITPEGLRDKSPAEIEKLDIFHGNHKLPLGEMFRVEGDASDDRIEWSGDLAGVHWIGAKMVSGEIHADGPVGRHLGSEMRGGEIHVSGDAGDWVGGEMHGGLIHVRGRAGHLVGAAYRGSARGMTAGTILIDGDVGNEVGHTMRRGLLAVGGACGDLAGFNMLAGTILVLGGCGIRHGAGMHRGTLAFLGERPPLLPSFRYACRFRPTALRLIFRELRRRDFTVPDELFDADVELYNGDMIEGGRGEFLLRAP
jgi:formylmethanofuran dehydrogenase subunit C